MITNVTDKSYFKLLLVLAIAIVFQSCATIKTDNFYKVPVKNSFVIKNKSYDDCWNRLVDFLAFNNFKFDIIDKDAGYISLKNYILCKANYQCMEDYTSCVMVQNVRANNPPVIKGAMNINIRIYKEKGNVVVKFFNKTKVLILFQHGKERNLVKDFNENKENCYTFKNGWRLSTLKSQSTGSFEKDVIDYICRYN